MHSPQKPELQLAQAGTNFWIVRNGPSLLEEVVSENGYGNFECTCEEFGRPRCAHVGFVHDVLYEGGAR